MEPAVDGYFEEFYDSYYKQNIEVIENLWEKRIEQSEDDVEK